VCLHVWLADNIGAGALKLWYLELSGTPKDIASMGISDSSLEWFGFDDLVGWGGTDLFVGAGPGAVCRVVVW